MIAVVHHWDSDGICSAGIFCQYLEESGVKWINVSPLPGVFEFDENIICVSEKAEKTVLLDLNLPEEVSKLNGDVIFIDHHIQERIDGVLYINPLVTERREVPSASWVVSEYTGKWNHLTAIGAVGDNGMAVFETEEGEKLRRLLKDAGLDEKSAERVAILMDTPSVIGDKKGVEKAVLKVVNGEPEELLNDEEWLNNLDKIELEIARILDGIEHGRTAFLEFKSDYNIISRVARIAVWNMGFKSVLAINRDFRGIAQVYFRISPEVSESISLSEIIKALKLRGFNAGGKKDVLGCQCKREEVEMVVNIIRSFAGDLIGC